MLFSVSKGNYRVLNHSPRSSQNPNKSVHASSDPSLYLQTPAWMNNLAGYISSHLLPLSFSNSLTLPPSFFFYLSEVFWIRFYFSPLGGLWTLMGLYLKITIQNYVFLFCCYSD